MRRRSLPLSTAHLLLYSLSLLLSTTLEKVFRVCLLFLPQQGFGASTFSLEMAKGARYSPLTEFLDDLVGYFLDTQRSRVPFRGAWCLFGRGKEGLVGSEKFQVVSVGNCNLTIYLYFYWRELRLVGQRKNVRIIKWTVWVEKNSCCNAYCVVIIKLMNMEKTVSKVNATTALKKHHRTNEFWHLLFYYTPCWWIILRLYLCLFWISGLNFSLEFHWAVHSCDDLRYFIFVSIDKLVFFCYAIV